MIIHSDMGTLLPVQTFGHILFAYRLFSVGNGTMAQKTFFWRGYSNYKF